MSVYENTLYWTKLDSTVLLKNAVGHITSDMDPKIINCAKENKKMAVKKSEPSTSLERLK